MRDMRGREFVLAGRLARGLGLATSCANARRALVEFVLAGRLRAAKGPAPFIPAPVEESATDRADSALLPLWRLRAIETFCRGAHDVGYALGCDTSAQGPLGPGYIPRC